jgi:ketosteroid isomerase-like protein
MDMVSKKEGVASIAMGEITRGWEAIRTDMDSMVGSEDTFKVALGTIDMQSLAPGVALAFAPCTVTLSTAEGSLQFRGALSLVVEKSTGKWKVFHEHTSIQIPQASTEGE